MTKKEFLERITINPNIQNGKPCIKSTRTPVYVILEALALGMTPKEICREYPPLTPEDVQACIYYGALLADEQEIVPSIA